MSTDHLDLGSHPDFSEYRICYSRARALGWVEPALTVEVLSHFYQGAYGRHWARTVDDSYLTKMRHRAAVQREFIQIHTGMERVEGLMDVGCGAGLLLEAFAPSAVCIKGWETDAVLVSWAREHLNPQIEVVDRHFDVTLPPDRPHALVTMSHVLEHIPEPVGLLRALQSWMVPGGFLFVEVPNDPLASVVLQVRHKITGLAHVNFFTPRSLTACALDAGFSLVKVATFGPSTVDLWRQRTGEAACVAPAEPVDKSFPLDTESPEDGAVIRMLLRYDA